MKALTRMGVLTLAALTMVAGEGMALATSTFCRFASVSGELSSGPTTFVFLPGILPL